MSLTTECGSTSAFILKARAANDRYAALLLYQRAGTPFHQPWLCRHSYAKLPLRMRPLRRDLRLTNRKITEITPTNIKQPKATKYKAVPTRDVEIFFLC